MKFLLLNHVKSKTFPVTEKTSCLSINFLNYDICYIYTTKYKLSWEKLKNTFTFTFYLALNKIIKIIIQQICYKKFYFYVKKIYNKETQRGDIKATQLHTWWIQGSQLNFESKILNFLIFVLNRMNWSDKRAKKQGLLDLRFAHQTCSISFRVKKILDKEHKKYRQNIQFYRHFYFFFTSSLSFFFLQLNNAI